MQKILLVVLILPALVGAFFFGRSSQPYSEHSLKTQACTQNTRDDLEAKLKAMAQELKAKDAKLSDVYENLLKFLLIELGLKIQQKDIETIFFNGKAGPAVGATEAALKLASAIATPQKGPLNLLALQPQAQMSASIATDQAKFKDQSVFHGQVGSVFHNKQAVPVSVWEPFRALEGHYQGTVTYADKTEGPIEVTFRAVRDTNQKILNFETSIVMKNAAGQALIYVPTPDPKVKVLSFGSDDLPSVGKVRTVYIMSGHHHVALAWPVPQNNSESQEGMLLEGVYYFKGPPAEAPEGKASGTLYLYRK